MGGLGVLEGHDYFIFIFFLKGAGGEGCGVLGVLIRGGGKGFVFLQEWVGSSP
jgi:hypothetical protein